ncbi:MAG: UMP kinase [Endozoicomonadaceae bacterium]|nr:UMP kinase [Endozoicomonadaceae bacterium]
MSENFEKRLLKKKYNRILVKLSGEALMGEQAAGIDFLIVNRLAKELFDLSQQGIQIVLVIGAGNIFRGISLEKNGINRITGDHMGMLATVINALAMKDVLIQLGNPSQVLSSIPMDSITPLYHFKKAIHLLQQGFIIICAGGTGNPLFTTDTTASLRGIEMEVDIVIKATKVEGVYDQDPIINPQAKRYQKLSYDDVISKKLNIMDLTSIFLMREHKLPLIVCNIHRPMALHRIILGENEGTLIFA